MITGKLYNFLKFLAQIAIPAVATLYFTLANIWGFSSQGTQEILGTLIAFDTFLGALLGISQLNYNKQIAGGKMRVMQTEKGKMYSLELDQDPDLLGGKKEVRLNVVLHSPGR